MSAADLLLGELLAAAPNQRMVRHSPNELRHVLALAMRAGQLLLENGASTARVEETVHRIALALGAEHCDVYVTPTGIFATVATGSEQQTRIQRITRWDVDLSKVAAVSDISRGVWEGTLDHAAVGSALEAVAQRRREYRRLPTALAVGVASACSAVLFGGGGWALGISFVASIIAFLVGEWLSYIRISRALMIGVVSLLGAALTVALTRVFQAPNLPQSITASVLFLVPGVSLVSAVMDLFRGDTVSGAARGLAALLTLVAIAAGVWAALLMGQVPANLVSASQESLLLLAVCAFCSTAGFAIMFDVPRRAMLAAALVGTVATLIYRACVLAGFPAGVAAFAAGMGISALAELLARWFRMPAFTFTIPGFLPLVPGSAAFQTLLKFATNQYAAGTVQLVGTAIIVVALAAGTGTSSALIRFLWRTQDDTN